MGGGDCSFEGEAKEKYDKAIEKIKEKNLNKTDYEIGYIYAKENRWLVGGEHGALDYKMSIITTSPSKIIEKNPMYFGNMDNESSIIEKKGVLNAEIIMSINSFCSDIKKEIQSSLSHFFFLTNFGTRQSKGYGSFYPIKDNTDFKYEDIKTLNSEHNLYFDIKRTTLGKVLDNIDLFYKSMRSGLNVKSPIYQKDSSGKILLDDKKKIPEKDKYGVKMRTIFYFKSLIFLYGRHLDIQWEKKKIKEEFFLDNDISYNDKRGNNCLAKGLNQQRNEHRTPTDTPLFYENIDNVHILRDLFGLSSAENWQSYGTDIIKTEAKLIGKQWIKKEKKELIIERFPSPLTLKVFELDKCNYRVFININREIEKELITNILRKTFIVNQKDTNKEFSISFPDHFSFEDFFNYILTGNNFNIDMHIERQFIKNGYKDRDGNYVQSHYEILKEIYSQLKQNYRWAHIQQ
ncbi:hypothetical protein FACS1894160_3730 [Bacteroidia bacterium]|nr:hypothetical protein FACS1894123_08640 [Bacteroidia bacterium]GHV08815.1 hypothetical protein FACS1894160_3730 [Bacteroidia bacterium]